MRSAVPCSRQRATRRSNWPPRSLKLPGLMRTFSTFSAATRAASGTKWISATNGTEHPSSCSRARIAARFAASRRPCAVSRTISPPAPGNAPHLRRRGLGIVRVGVGHRLDPHGIPPADHHASHRHRTGGRTRISGKRIAIFSHGALFIESSFISGSPSAKRSPGTLSLPLPSPLPRRFRKTGPGNQPDNRA